MPKSFCLLPVVCVLVILQSQFSFSEDAPLPTKENFHLFLLVGQSNMAGRGKVAAEDKVAHPRVLTLNQSGKWEPAVAPLHFDKPKLVGVGLGRTFGMDIAKNNPDIVVGLIPCAVGGSSIDRWVPGKLHEQTQIHPYDAMLQRAKVALTQGTLKGILWHQGESDSSPKGSKVYEERLVALMARLRKDLNAKHVPFIIGQLGQFEEKPWNESRKKVDQAHRSVAGTHDHVGYVQSDGLTHKGDQTHFDAASYREFGHRFAKKYLEMTSE